MNMEKFDAATFAHKRREKLLDYKCYRFNFEEDIETFRIVNEDTSQSAEMLAAIPPLNLMEATSERAWQAVTHMQDLYSAGHEIAQIRACYPDFMDYWEAYARYSEAYKNTPEAKFVTVGHIALAGDEFSDALVMISFGILLGWKSLLPRFVPILDYRNSRDGMLEQMLINSDIARDPAPSECLRHLPYFKTLKIFKASPEDRPALMTEYLEDWYTASRREPYYDSHKRGDSFHGYWAWEAAAITVLLNIDDTRYRDAQFYPRDLVDFARQAQKEYAPAGMPDIEPNELRARAGDPCPKAGTWQSLDVHSTTQHFEQFQPMSNLNSAYGLTVWRFKERG